MSVVLVVVVVVVSSDIAIFVLKRDVKLQLTVVVVRPHRSTTYVDAAYCYRPSSVVCLSVGLSVCLSVRGKWAAHCKA